MAAEQSPTIRSRLTSQARRTHAELRRSISDPIAFERTDGNGGILVTTKAVFIHAKTADSIQQFPLDSIRKVRVHRGQQMEEVLVHFLTIEYEVGGDRKVATLRIPKQNAEEVAATVDVLLEKSDNIQFENEPTITRGLLLAFGFSFVLMLTVGTMRIAARNGMSPAEAFPGVIVLAAVILLVMVMFAMWQ